MSRIHRWCWKFGLLLAKQQNGQDLIEYALLGGFIAVAIAVILPNYVGTTVCNIFLKAISVLDARLTQTQ